MKIIYFDCFSGISGDMIIGALLDLGLNLKYLEKELKKLKLQDYKIEAKKIVKNGISATKFKVIEKKHDGHHNERNITEINSIIQKSKLNKNIKNTIKRIFLKIAVAEAKVHKTSISKVHFHEIGAVDTIIDIAGAVIGFNKLGIKKIYCSKLNVGTGFVEFSHGKWPVPAPATAEMLKGVPIYNNNIKSELVTPTGAAIITTLVKNFGEMPAMKLEKIGYGAGTKELSQPNVLRIFYGELDLNFGAFDDKIMVMEANIDNMNPEIFPYVIERMMNNGALDAYTMPMEMKKGRHGIKITALCDKKDIYKLSKILFEETTTLGIRIFPAGRKKLEREIKTINIKYGKIRVKISRLNGKIKNMAPEYEDCVKIARNKKIPLKEIYKEANKSKNLF
ncbi:nickel pincer cofactor biosynthesis protein LarC [Candidatus Woesearchaeota archaeon]|nr:nickel pincer cofactor biosynthesis protein LarC [Candidatus Woesearchaeota archaeon]